MLFFFSLETRKKKVNQRLAPAREATVSLRRGGSAPPKNNNANKLWLLNGFEAFAVALFSLSSED